MRLINIISLSLLTVSATAQSDPQKHKATLFHQVDYQGDESMDIPAETCVDIFRLFDSYLSLQVTNMTCFLYGEPDCNEDGDVLVVYPPGESDLKAKGWAGGQDGVDPYSIYCDTK